MTDLSNIKAERGNYSSVVGNSVHLIAEDGRMIGQIAILCHTDDLRGKDIQAALCERIVRGFDLDAFGTACVREGLEMAAATCRLYPDPHGKRIAAPIDADASDPTAIAAAVERAAGKVGE